MLFASQIFNVLRFQRKDIHISSRKAIRGSLAARSRAWGTGKEIGFSHDGKVSAALIGIGE
jgi:hypothetical protein